MPLFAGQQIVVPPPPPPDPVLPPPPVSPARPPDPGAYSATWHAPDGTVLQLNAPRTWLRSAPRLGGVGAVPVDLVTTASADGGTVVEDVRDGARTINWPLFLRASTSEAFRVPWWDVVDKFTQTKRLGPGRLRITRPTGAVREIRAIYSNGLEVDPSGSDGAWRHVQAPLALYCAWPYWYDVDPIVVERTQETGVPFLDPFLTLSSGAVLGDTEITNPGDADVWPTWTVRGPMTSLTATNTTTGKAFVVTHTLAAGEVLTISSRPIRVTGPGGTNLLDKLNLPTGRPWSLPARTTCAVTFTVAGAAGASGGDEATQIRLSFNAWRETF